MCISHKQCSCMVSNTVTVVPKGFNFIKIVCISGGGPRQCLILFPCFLASVMPTFHRFWLLQYHCGCSANSCKFCATSSVKDNNSGGLQREQEFFYNCSSYTMLQSQLIHYNTLCQTHYTHTVVTSSIVTQSVIHQYILHHNTSL